MTESLPIHIRTALARVMRLLAMGVLSESEAYHEICNLYLTK